jgi:hypothetical protein
MQFVNEKGKRKRNRVLTILLLPALISIFLMGWGLYSMNYQKGNYIVQNKLTKKDNVTIMPIAFDEKQEIGLQVHL